MPAAYDRTIIRIPKSGGDSQSYGGIPTHQLGRSLSVPTIWELLPGQGWAAAVPRKAFCLGKRKVATQMWVSPFSPEPCCICWKTMLMAIFFCKDSGFGQLEFLASWFLGSKSFPAFSGASLSCEVRLQKPEPPKHWSFHGFPACLRQVKTPNADPDSGGVCPSEHAWKKYEISYMPTVMGSHIMVSNRQIIYTRDRR